MTLLNVPGSTIVPAPVEQTNKKGRTINAPVVQDAVIGMRLLALGFWFTR
jgi:hypothetical protein